MNDKVVQTDNENFENDVIKNSMPTAVYFYSEDCAPCMAFSPIFDRLADKYNGHMKFIKIFRQHNRQLAEKYNVKSSPTVLFFKDGQEVCSRLTGYITGPEFRNVVDGVIQGVCITREKEKVYCDVLILGGGPAGLSAAIYAARAKLLTVVVDEGLTGGQVSTTFHVANYPGTNGVIRGMDLMENIKKQALDFGTQIDDLKEIKQIELDAEEKYVSTEDTEYFAKTVIIATGAQPRKLPVNEEKEFRGRGVHYCATCDGAMYQDTNVLVIGGGNSAVEEAVFLTRYVKHVTIIHQFDYFQASKAAQDEAFKNPNISVIWDSQVSKINGDNFVKSVIIENIKTKETREIETDGLFVYIGMQPKTDMFKGLVEMDENAYIKADEDMKTNIEGVFVAGDVRIKKVRQIATATADGVIAGIMAERYVNAKDKDKDKD
jgi:thioredoxin reductase (NADPH)